MTDLQPENRGFYRATVFLRALWQSGVEHVVISPGSRSTPLTLAAAMLPYLQKRVVLDERSAAFMALGIGKSTAKPAALICTSGTALANYFPAVIEARKSGVPLLLLTADRPAHLHQTGANQTINQHQIFGDYPVFFHHMDEIDPDKKELKDLGEQSVLQACEQQGPVHLNFPFQKPLEPTKDFVKRISDENDNLARDESLNISPHKNHQSLICEAILKQIDAAKRPLLITGQLAPATRADAIFALAEKLNAPVLSEQGIVNSRYAVQGFEGFLRHDDNHRALKPDVILRFGREPASKSLLQAISRWSSTPHLYFADSENKSNIRSTTTDFIKWSGRSLNVHSLSKKSPAWLKQWKHAEARYFENSTRIVENAEKLTDGHIYHHLVPAIPDHWTVFVSNSLPARDQSMFGQWKNHKLFTNRGASGIDGITSTAMGINIGLHEPGLLFTGDLAFLHDTNALLNHRNLEQPLVIVVINNGGGSIFRMLPVARHTAHFKTYFETPQQADITALCQSYGIHAISIKTINELRQFKLNAFISKPNGMLHVLECKTDADASMALRKKLWGFQL